MGRAPEVGLGLDGHGEVGRVARPHRRLVEPAHCYTSWICSRLVVPGLPEGRPAVMPTRSPGLNQPSSTTRARGRRDQFLGDLVAAHRRRLHAPHQPAAAHGLAARGERDDRHRRPVGGDQPRGAAAQRRADERVEVELVRRPRRRVGQRVRRVAPVAPHAALVPLPVRARSARCAWRSSPASPPTRPATAPTALSWESMTASVPSRIALATSVTSARVGREEATIESSICVAVITGRARAPAQRDDLLLHDRDFLDLPSRCRGRRARPSRSRRRARSPPRA